MIGLTLNWCCKKCGTQMHDAASIVSIYEVNGHTEYLKLFCDSCKHPHFVRTYSSNSSSDVIDSEEAVSVKDIGVCCY